MDYQQMVDSMTRPLYDTLKRSLELGKWPDGRVLTQEQREHTLQALIVWGEKHLPEEQRIGYIDRGHKAGSQCDDPQETPLNWKQ
tara:strand:- start:133603 stop:133857 length:255 start_codon:yes stop_codon:yes gene_type:complete